MPKHIGSHGVHRRILHLFNVQFQLLLDSDVLSDVSFELGEHILVAFGLLLKFLFNGTTFLFSFDFLFVKQGCEAGLATRRQQLVLYLFEESSLSLAL